MVFNVLEECVFDVVVSQVALSALRVLIIVINLSVNILLFVLPECFSVHQNLSMWTFCAKLICTIERRAVEIAFIHLGFKPEVVQ